MALQTARPTSPAEGIYMREDFFGNGLITTNNVGRNDWAFTAIESTGTFTYLTEVVPDRPFGGIRHLTNVGAGAGDALHMLAVTSKFPASDKGGGFAFRFMYPAIADNVIATNSFWIGVHTTRTATAPTDGILVGSAEGVLTLRADSVDSADAAVAFAAGSTLTSGTTAVLGVAHDIQVQWSGTNSAGGPADVEAYCDGEPVASLVTGLANDEAASPCILHWCTGTDTLELDVHYFEYWQYMDYPTAADV